MNEYMKIAKEQADNNLKTNVGGPFGACIVKNGEIIGKLVKTRRMKEKGIRFC